MPVCLSEICREEMGLVLVEFGELNLSCSLFERRKVYTVGIPTSNLCILIILSLYCCLYSLFSWSLFHVKLFYIFSTSMMEILFLYYVTF